jgi:hypothetical protein
MQEREPYLYHQYIGQFTEGGTAPPMPEPPMPMPATLSEGILRQQDRRDRAARLREQEERYAAVEEETDSDEEAEREERQRQEEQAAEAAGGRPEPAVHPASAEERCALPTACAAWWHPQPSALCIRHPALRRRWRWPLLLAAHLRAQGGERRRFPGPDAAALPARPRPRR